MVLFGVRFFMAKEGLDQLVSVQNRTKKGHERPPRKPLNNQEKRDAKAH
jgi:hypothetical protein